MLVVRVGLILVDRTSLDKSVSMLTSSLSVQPGTQHSQRHLVYVVFVVGVGGAREPDPVEYDLDNEDEDWLKQYNLGRNKLGDLLFEKMLWKLELACAEATDSALTAAGEVECICL